MTLSPLNAIIDDDLAARAGWSLTDLAAACLEGGARFLQIRAKNAAAGTLLRVAETIVRLAHAADAIVIVNDRVDIARLSGADGVHLGQDDLDPAAARRILSPGAIIGRSTHSVQQARAAAREPVDYIAVGPLFATSTKETGYGAAGTALVREVRAALDADGIRTPIVGIGGITVDRAAEVRDAGAASVAVISDLLSTDAPAQRVREYLRRLP